VAAGIICFYMVVVIKQKYAYDDSLDAFGVHGIGGILGATITGVLAEKATVVNQLTGAAIAIAISVVGCYIALQAARLLTGGLKMETREEIQGMDLVIHGEEGYNLES
jgi:ammonium transporter, Amt family